MMMDPTTESNQPNTTQNYSPLLVFNTLDHHPTLAPFGPGYQKIKSFLTDSPSSIQWIRGPEGIGKTTLIKTILNELHSGESKQAGILRVSCSPRLRLEESLTIISEFLCQLGIHDYDRILQQRNTLRAKIQILIGLLEQLPITIWFDDFQNLVGTSHRCSKSAIEILSECCSSFDSQKGRILITTNSQGPDGIGVEAFKAQCLELSPGDISSEAELWEHFQSECEGVENFEFPNLNDIPIELRSNAFALNLIAKNAIYSPDNTSFRSRTLEGISRELRSRLSDAGRYLLDILAIHGTAMTRGALRGFAKALDQPEIIEAGLEELRKWNVVTHEKASDPRLQLDPALQRGADKDLQRENPDLWSKLHETIAHHHLETAKRSRSIWKLYQSFEHYFVGGHHQDAYEVQKTFLETLLGQGFLEISKSVLERCIEAVKSPYREIVAGNLAIVYKNEGNHDEAIRIYKESLVAFAKRGDAANTARVYHQIGNTYYLQGKNEKALTNYQSCLEIAENLDDKNIAMMARVQVANIQFALKDFEAAFEVYGEALNAARTSSNKLMVTALSLQLGQIHLNRKEFSQADEVLLEAETTAREEEDLRHLMKIQQVQGVVATRMHKDAEALNKFQEAKDLARQLGDLTEEANCEIHLGAMQEKRHKYKESLVYLFSARATVEKLQKVQEMTGESSNVAEVIDSINTRIEKLKETTGEETFNKILASIAGEE